MSGTADGNLKYLTKKEIGSFTIFSPDKLIAGEYGTVVLTYTVGKYGIDIGGGIKIGMKRMTDWGIPQFSDPSAPDYVSVKCSSPEIVLETYYNPKGHIRTYKAVTVIDLKKGILKEGDKITVVFGDKTGGSAGIKVQSFPETECEFGVFVDVCCSGAYTKVPRESSTMQVITGKAVGYMITVPSKIVAGTPFKIKVNGTDIIGNPTPCSADDLEIDLDPPIKFSLKPEEGRTKWIEECIVKDPGEYYFHLKKGDRALAVSNPCIVTEKKELNLYWGDTQAQTASTVGTGTVKEYYEYAKNTAGIDFCSHQANDFMVSRSAWKEICEGGKNSNKPGEFIAFTGYEWSGNFPVGGDRNVLFLDDDPVFYCSSSWQMPEGLPEAERSDAGELHKSIKAFMKEKNKKVLLILHVGGRRANLDYYDPALEPVLEICSCHGHFEWFLHEALERGYKVGVTGASDDSTCRPGLTLPARTDMAVHNALGGVYAEELTRESVAEAFFARRCYVTTGERIVLWVDSDGNPMGSDYISHKAPLFKAKILGTAPIRKIEFFDKSKKIAEKYINERKRIKNKIRITWTGLSNKDRNRYTLWDGGLSLSSGKIVSACALNMSSEWEGIIKQTEDGLQWKSMTVGNDQGVIIEVDAPDDAEIDFKTAPASFSFKLKDVYEKDLHIDAGGVGQAVDITTMHIAGDKKVAEVEFTDSFSKGNHAYYVKVIQENFHKAWSSPVFVSMN